MTWSVVSGQWSVVRGQWSDVGTRTRVLKTKLKTQAPTLHYTLSVNKTTMVQYLFARLHDDTTEVRRWLCVHEWR